MAYISKKDILSAYKKLSEMHPDPTAQGATQKISAIRYFVALDIFYKLHASDCNTRNTTEKMEFANLVGFVCDVCPNYYTTNFYFPLRQHQGDFCVGSNFFSAGRVNDSNVNTSVVLDYPKRGGRPLIRVQNGILKRDTSLYENLNNYIPSTEFKVAFVIWLLRNCSVNSGNGKEDYTNIYDSLANQITSELLDVLSNEPLEFKSILDSYNLSFESSPCTLTESDINVLFNSAIIMPTSRQIIYYGAPGTGKSHEVKKLTGELDANGNDFEKDNVFRTTFHPDTDYASFVGCYKPGMKETGQQRKVNGKSEEIEEISYEFIPQAFTDAYVYAYQHTDESTYLVIE